MLQREKYCKILLLAPHEVSGSEATAYVVRLMVEHGSYFFVSTDVHGVNRPEVHVPVAQSPPFFRNLNFDLSCREMFTESFAVSLLETADITQAKYLGHHAVHLPDVEIVQPTHPFSHTHKRARVRVCNKPHANSQHDVSLIIIFHHIYAFYHRNTMRLCMNVCGLTDPFIVTNHFKKDVDHNLLPGL